MKIANCVHEIPLNESCRACSLDCPDEELIKLHNHCPGPEIPRPRWDFVLKARTTCRPGTPEKPDAV